MTNAAKNSPNGLEMEGGESGKIFFSIYIASSNLWLNPYASQHCLPFIWFVVRWLKYIEKENLSWINVNESGL